MLLSQLSFKWSLIVIFIISAYAYGGNKTSDYKRWIILATGQGFPQDDSKGLSYNFGRNDFYQLAINCNSDFTLDETTPRFSFVSIAKGYCLSDRFTHVALFVGPAYLWGSRKYIHNSDNRFKSVGVVSNIQIVFKPLSVLGVGSDIFYLLNYNKNSLGIRMVLFIGHNK